MGYRVESYSLEELHRIAVPGAAPPTLFWVLPVGDWLLSDLDNLWRHFTSREEGCAVYGLLLVKDLQRRDNTDNRVDLADIGATLTDVIPRGAERFVGSSAFRREAARLFVLSGAYPQPGWGVLIDHVGDAESLERLLANVLQNVRSRSDAFSLEVFEEASRAYYELQPLLTGEPVPPDLGIVEREIEELEQAREKLAAAYEAIEKRYYTETAWRLFAALGVLEKPASLNIPQEALDSLAAMQRKLNGARSILSVSPVELATFGPLIPELLSNSSGKAEAFRKLPNEQCKRALKAALWAIENGLVSEPTELWAWASKIESEVADDIESAIAPLLAQIDETLTGQLGRKAFESERYERECQLWRDRIGPAREAFHAAVTTASRAQWELGPHFLVALEDECRSRRVWARSIPWDPARMVGWKLIAHNLRLQLVDVQASAREISPGVEFESPVDPARGAVADGSYFTDYVHYLAASQPRLSPRHIASKFLANLLRANELDRLLREHESAPSDLSDRAALADSLLDCLGWRKAKEARETPLSACIQKQDDSGFDVAHNLSGNDLRIVAESFVKDLIDVLVSILGYNEPQIGAVLRERLPRLRRGHGSWSELIAKVTLGPAHMLVSCFGPLAFPERQEEVARLAENLRELSKDLNALSHHRPGHSSSAPTGQKIASLIRAILEDTITLLGECPWHLEPSVVYGDQPKVLTGEAWSHGSPTPRLLRVIVWGGVPVPAKPLLWNRTRTNPVITDPVFIHRP